MDNRCGIFSRIRPNTGSGQFLTGFLLSILLSGCAMAPVATKATPTKISVTTSPDETRTLLEKIQAKNPGYTIQALLSPQGDRTEARIAVYDSHTVHMVIRGFQEPAPHKRLYPDCDHWFYLTRNFDRACGGGPYLGTASMVFADGMGFGALFDLFQATRYPFTFTKVVEPDKKATADVIAQLLNAAKPVKTGTRTLPGTFDLSTR